MKVTKITFSDRKGKAATRYIKHETSEQFIEHWLRRYGHHINATFSELKPAEIEELRRKLGEIKFSMLYTVKPARGKEVMK